MDIKDNPDWEPFLDAVKAVRRRERPHGKTLRRFICSYPEHLHEAVALALSVAKRHLVENGLIVEPDVWVNCGCCVLHTPFVYTWQECVPCPLGPGSVGCLYIRRDPDRRRSPAEITAHILAIYTEHFDALPKRDRQQ